MPSTFPRSLSPQPLHITTATNNMLLSFPRAFYGGRCVKCGRDSASSGFTSGPRGSGTSWEDVQKWSCRKPERGRSCVSKFWQICFNQFVLKGIFEIMQILIADCLRSFSSSGALVKTSRQIKESLHLTVSRLAVTHLHFILIKVFLCIMASSCFSICYPPSPATCRKDRNICIYSF